MYWFGGITVIAAMKRDPADIVPGYFVKGRRIGIIGLSDTANIIADQYAGIKTDEMSFNITNYAYSYNNKLEFYVALRKLLQLYVDSKRSWHPYPIRLKGHA